MSADASLKQDVHDYWNRESCGTEFGRGPKHTHEYYDAIEEQRYRVCPEVYGFAQFTRAHGKRVLEVGVGAATDFVQWARAGAHASGVDLTEEAVEHAKHRLALDGLEADVQVADCESLPFAPDSFDLVYSMGVIHHTPDTRKAFDEIVRVCRPGGRVKIMVYHRHSMVSYVLWLKHALFKFRPWRSLAWCLHHHMESVGTKAYTFDEIRQWLDEHGVTEARVWPHLTCYDVLHTSRRPFRFAARVLANLLGHHRVGWFLFVDFRKPDREPLAPA